MSTIRPSSELFAFGGGCQRDVPRPLHWTLIEQQMRTRRSILATQRDVCCLTPRLKLFFNRSKFFGMMQSILDTVASINQFYGSKTTYMYTSSLRASPFGCLIYIICITPVESTLENFEYSEVLQMNRMGHILARQCATSST